MSEIDMTGAIALKTVLPDGHEVGWWWKREEDRDWGYVQAPGVMPFLAENVEEAHATVVSLFYPDMGDS